MVLVLVLMLVLVLLLGELLRGVERDVLVRLREEGREGLLVVVLWVMLLLLVLVLLKLRLLLLLLLLLDRLVRLRLRSWMGMRVWVLIPPSHVPAQRRERLRLEALQPRVFEQQHPCVAHNCVHRSFHTHRPSHIHARHAHLALRGLLLAPS